MVGLYLIVIQEVGALVVSTRVPSGLRVSSKLESSLVEITGSMPTKIGIITVMFSPTARALNTAL